MGAREFGEGTARLWRADVFEVTARFELQPSDDDRLVRGEEEEEGRGRYPVVRLDPAEHVAHLWAGQDEVRAGWCGGVELVLTDPDWRRVMLEAFELHRMSCGC